MQILTFLLIALGGLFIIGVPNPFLGLRGKIRRAAEMLSQHPGTVKKESAKDYVARINGKTRETLMARSRREARQIYEQTGQSARYGKTLRMALVSGACGALFGLFLHNIMLSIVLAVGFYFLPLWWSQFSLFRYNQYLNEELETALNLITTSYTRNNDILAAVEENLKNINGPLHQIFAAFANNVKYVDANAPAQIERMKATLDNHIFWQWCDALILCQADHTLRDVLPPIVSKFAVQKAQQEENATKMMLPLQRATGMICLTLSIIPAYYLAYREWFDMLVGSLFGQVSLVITAIIVLATINKAIRLSKPIEYNV